MLRKVTSKSIFFSPSVFSILPIFFCGVVSSTLKSVCCTPIRFFFSALALGFVSAILIACGSKSNDSYTALMHEVEKLPPSQLQGYEFRSKTSGWELVSVPCPGSKNPMQLSQPLLKEEILSCTAQDSLSLNCSHSDHPKLAQAQSLMKSLQKWSQLYGVSALSAAPACSPSYTFYLKTGDLLYYGSENQDNNIGFQYSRKVLSSSWQLYTLKK